MDGCGEVVKVVMSTATRGAQGFQATTICKAAAHCSDHFGLCMASGRGNPERREKKEEGRTDTRDGKEKGRFGEGFFLLGAAWTRSQAERPSVSKVSGQLHCTIRMQIAN